MTCIVAIAKEGKVWIGGDSAGISGSDVTVRKDPKVFYNGEFLIGFAGSFRMGQILMHSFIPPTQAEGTDNFGFMVHNFVNELRLCFNSLGYGTIESNNESGGSFLVGYRGELYAIQDDYQVGVSVDGIDAIGCGYKYALGSVLTNEKAKPAKRILKALEVSTFCNGGVRPPYTILSI